MQQRTFAEEIKYQWNYGGPHIQMIGINLLVFLVIGTLLVFGRLFTGSEINSLHWLVQNIFTLHGNIKGFLMRPWGIVTSMFAHFDLFHFLFNMIFLYFVGRMFLMYFSAKRLWATYVMGGLLGGIFQILAYSIFPGLQGVNTYVVGASGSIMAIFMAVAFYRPMEEVMLFGIIRIKMIFIAGVFILLDLFRLGTQDNIAHFAHLGGIVFGIWSIRNLHARNNIVEIGLTWWENVLAKFNNQPKKLKVKRGGKVNNQTKTDDEFRKKKMDKQAEIDAILDKISKSGYDSLTKKEKQILFDQSKNV